MPDGVVDPMEAFHAGQAQVVAWLATSSIDLRTLSAADLSGYTGRSFEAGWRFPVKFADGSIRHMELLLPTGFPWQPPRVALIDRPAFLTWPHIERDGLLCLAPNALEIDPEEPAEVAAGMLGAASELIEMLIRGDYDSEFRDDFSPTGTSLPFPGYRLSLPLFSPRRQRALFAYGAAGISIFWPKPMLNSSTGSLTGLAKNRTVSRRRPRLSYGSAHRFCHENTRPPDRSFVLLPRKLAATPARCYRTSHAARDRKSSVAVRIATIFHSGALRLGQCHLFVVMS
jgi:Prokaryotic E2 family B